MQGWWVIDARMVLGGAFKGWCNAERIATVRLKAELLTDTTATLSMCNRLPIWLCPVAVGQLTSAFNTCIIAMGTVVLALGAS